MSRDSKKKKPDRRRDRKLSCQQHSPKLHLPSVSRWTCEEWGPPPTSRPQLYLSTVEWIHKPEQSLLSWYGELQWNKILLIRNQKNIHMWPQLLVPSRFPALTLVSRRAAMLAHGYVFPSTLQEMHHSSLWCCWRWWEGGFFLTGKCKNNYQPLAPGPSQCANN